MKPYWQGVLPAITTQMHKDGSLDLNATAAHDRAEARERSRGFEEIRPGGYALMDDFYSGRIDIGKAEPRRRRSRDGASATNSTPTVLNSTTTTNETR